MVTKKDWDRCANPSSYFSEVTSPFCSKKRKFELIQEIKKHSNNKKRIIDLGTGLGILIPHLSQLFKQVTAIDYSPKMVEYCNKHYSKLSNAQTKVANINNLGKYYSKYDVAVAVNSIFPTKLHDIDRMLGEVKKTLKPRGIFIGVFPSMNSELYTARIVYEDQLKKLKNYKKAKQKTKKAIMFNRYDFLLGTVRSEDGEQKYYYNLELEERLKKAGFKDIEIKKLHYPWKANDDPDLYFLGKEEPWDWLVFAK